jgi:Ricin-type beta-trefoil lectin domain
MDDDEIPPRPPGPGPTGPRPTGPRPPGPGQRNDTLALPEAGRPDDTARYLPLPSRRRDPRTEHSHRAATAGAAGSRSTWLAALQSKVGRGRTPWLGALGGLIMVVPLSWVVLQATSGDAPAPSAIGRSSGPAPSAGAPGTGGPGMSTAGGRAGAATSTSPTGPVSSPGGPRNGSTRPAGDQALIASPIVGVQSGKCVDVAGGSTADLTPVELARCDDGPAQAISYTAAGELRVLGKCLDAKGAGTGNGTPIILFTCSGQPNQKWYLGSDATIRGAQSNLCLDATGFGTDDGTPLQLWSCTGGPNQAWNS